MSKGKKDREDFAFCKKAEKREAVSIHLKMSGDKYW